MNGDSEDPDLGEPIAQLAELSDEPRPGFLDRVRGSIDRRRLGSQVSGLAWHGLALVLLEFLAMMMTLLVGARAGSDEKRNQPPTV